MKQNPVASTVYAVYDLGCDGDRESYSAAHPRHLWRLASVLLLSLGILLAVLLWIGGCPLVTRAAPPPHRYVAPAPIGTDTDNDCSASYNPCATIQKAIDEADPGDEIRVAAGIYTDTVSLNKNLTLRGGFTTTNWITPDPDQNLTIIDAQGAGRVIHVASAISATVRGFHLTGGSVSGKGAGVYNEFGTLTIEDSQIYGNQAFGANSGGGVANGAPGSAATTILRRSQVYSNITQFVGGGVGVILGTAQIEASEIFSNSAVNGGGGIAVLDGNATIRSSLICSNTASNGGGIAVNVGTATADIENDSVYANYAANLGGGIYAAGATAITNTLIISNTAINGGGGIYSGTSALGVSFTDFFGNSPNHIQDSTGTIDPTALGSSNRITNPLFVAPQLFDLHLSAGSPAIDSGTVSPGVATDFEGNGRPFGAAMDRGADEYTTYSPCYARLENGQVYTDVQMAVDAAGDGDAVQVAGRCSGVKVRAGFTQTVYISRTLTLRGGYTVTNWTAPQFGPTVLDAQGLGRVIYITGTAAIAPLIENLHITNGRGDYGGGIYVGHNISATLQNNVIYRNEATQDGGGVYNQGSSILLQHNTLYSNTASRGGGVFASDMAGAGLGMYGLSDSNKTPSIHTTPPRLPLRFRSGTFDPLTDTPSVPAKLERSATTGQPGLYIVQFSGPIRDAWIQAIASAGLEIITYIPDYGYLVWGDSVALSRLSIAAPLRWSGVYQPFYALHPALALPEELEDEVEVVIQVYNHPGAMETLREIQHGSIEVLSPPQQVLSYYNLSVRVATDQLTWLVSLPDVVNVEPFPHFEPLDELQGQILAGHLNGAGTQPSGPGYLAWLQSVGFSTDPADYPIVDVTDDGIDDGSDTPIHADFYVLGSKLNADRLAYNFNWSTDPAADGEGGHGNLNASIVVGYNDLTGAAYEDGNGYNYGLGISPYGRVAGSKVFCNSGPWCAGTDHGAIISQTYALGGRISSNSWGSPFALGDYDIAAQTYDALVRDAQSGGGPFVGNQEIIILFGAGNAGPSGNTVSSPSTAKNIIAVGAAENYRPTWTDGCGKGPSDADSAMDIAGFSSRGPTDDGRVKPDLVAPGTHIIGAASQDPGYNGATVCDQYHPPAQTLYAASSGTSLSAPAAAGAASLIHRYYQDHFGGQPPSPAMVKAYMLNATRYLNGTGAGGTLPSNDQGYGEILLGMAFDGTPRVAVDQSEVLTDSGEIYEMQGWVADPAQPFRVTLAWTDAPGPTVGDAYVNNLDLEVVIDGEVFKGNVFSGDTSITGGAADPRNNVESVFLPAGQRGAFTVRVIATNIAGDGLPGNADSTDQDFALVVHNGVQSIVTLDNNILVDNHATSTGGGGGIYASNGHFTLSYNDFYGNTSGSTSDNYGNVVTGTTDISAPPGFADPGAGDFHLTVTSVPVNAADPASTLAIDFDGQSRPQGTRSDIGADESLQYAEVELSDADNSPLIVTDIDDIRGKTITFTHIITNLGDTGAGSDSIAITTTNSSGWTVTLVGISPPVVLPTGASQTFDVIVSVPTTITQVFNQTTITATSEANAAAFDVAWDIVANPGVELAPNYTENADPGEVVTYTHTLTNTGEGPDVFTTSLSSSLGWGELVTPTAPIALGAGETAWVIARVMVAHTAPANLADVTTIKATSSFSVGIFAIVTDTTIANPTTGDRYVATSGSDTDNNCTQQAYPCATIKYAVSQAAWGDAVLVAQGTYTESDIFINQNMSLRGGYLYAGGSFSLPPGGIDPTTTIIDAQGSGRGLRMQVPGGYHPVVEGFTIQNASTSGYGGAVYLQSSSSPTMTKLIILDSSATRGGGIYIDTGSPVVQNVTISGTAASGWGGGIYVGGGSPLIQSVSISNTTAINGGGVHCAGGNTTAQQLRIWDGTASGQGGGVYHAGGTLTLSQSRIHGNTANGGGGFYHSAGTLNLWNNFVYSNTAATDSGGGIHQEGGTLNLINDTLYGNQAATSGGGIHGHGNSTAVISNTVVATNTATTGGGLYRTSGSGSLTIDYNNFWGNTASSFPDSNVGTGSHSISADPLFVDAAIGDLRIAFESPCVDTGDPDTFLTTDIDGDIRPSNQGFDIGADELGGCLARIERTGEVFGVLQDAIDTAVNGDTIQISGVCQGVQSRLVGGRVISQTAFVDKRLTLEGGYASDFGNNPITDPVTTTLDARGLGRTVMVTDVLSAKISNLTLTNGDASGLGGGPGGGDAGGGIYNDADTLVVTRTVIVGNQASFGGGLYNAAGTLILGGLEAMDAVDITNNAATYGGGMYVGGGSPWVVGVNFEQNAAIQGGALYNAGSSTVVSRTTFYSNTANTGGGVYNTGGAQLTVQQSVVLSNTASTSGGGLYNIPGGNLTLVNTIIASNDASTNGGGLYNLSSSLTVRHDTFYANSAGSQGGGIYHSSSSSSPVFNSTLIVNNTATSGGGIYSANAGPQFDYNNYYGNTIVGVAGTGNISADPNFISTDPASSSFLRIPAGSPAEDTADPGSPITFDIDDDPRPSNQGFDIGADEVGGCYVRINGQPPTYGSIQLAVGKSSTGDRLHVAGICQGVNTFVVNGQTVSQTVFLTKSLNIQGGYTLTNWTVSQPISNPTVLDALTLGRVVYVTNTSVISVSGLHLRGGSASDGGGIFVGGGVLTATGNFIYNNTATNGGATYSAGGEATLDSNDIRNNQATNGGAFYHAGGSALIQNNIIRNNQATNGAGIYNASTNLTVWHNTLYANTATTNGGGFYTANGSPILVSNIFFNNTATTGHAVYSPASFTPDYNDVYPAANGYGGSATAGAHSLTVNPLLVNPAGGDFHLQSSSPVIDKGDPAMTLLHDFEGEPRPSEQGFDMGADEFAGCWAKLVRTGVVYGSPQRAIDKSIPGDEIWISRGECRGVHPYDDGGQVISQTIHVTHSLTLRGGFSRDFLSGGNTGPLTYPDPTATTVDPNGLGRAILITNSASVTLTRFILINGDADGLGGGPAGGDAGGLFYYAGNYARLEHVDFYSSTAAYGGSLFSAGDNFNMLNSWINYNTASEHGGAIYNATGTITITAAIPFHETNNNSTRIYNNTAGSQGGGIYNDSGTVLVLYNNVHRDPHGGVNALNQADEGGYLYNNSGQAYLVDNTIFQNTAEDGGAIYNNTGTVTLEENEIYSNDATHGGTGRGAGFFNASGTATLNLGNRFYDNDADGDGGAVYNTGVLTAWNTLIYENTAFDQGGGIYTADSDPSLVHNTFYENEVTSGTGLGGGICVESGSPTIKNTIFLSNTAGSNGGAVYATAGSTPTIDYNDYHGNSPNTLGGVASDGGNSFTVDPQLENPAGADFHLDDTSPLIDAAEADLGVSRDFEYDPRPVNTGPDIGADEYAACLARLVSTGVTYGRIQLALDDAISGDTIQVAEGVCEESITIDKDITISGSWDEEFIIPGGYPPTTIIDADKTTPADRVVTINSGVNSVSISHVALINGDATGSNGGGIWSGADSLTLVDSTVVSGTATDGGGIYIDVGTAALNDVAIRYNQATSDGGGLYANNGVTVTLLGGGFLDNEALGGNGGGMYLGNSSYGYASGGWRIGLNQASGNGGGVYASSATLILSNKQVSENEASYGGGIYVSGSSVLEITNGLFYTNTAQNDGGGLYRSSSGSAAVYHTTFHENEASGNGGGVYNAGSSMVISASIVADNTSNSGGSGIHGAAGAAVSVAYTLQYNNSYVNVSSGGGNLSGNPYFYDEAGWFLSYNSPAIDAVPVSASHVAFDAYLDARPQICAKDMGPDEYLVNRAMTWVNTPDPTQATLAPSESVTYTYSLRNDSEAVPISGLPGLGLGTGYTETVTFNLNSSKGWAEITQVVGGANAVIQSGGQSATVDIGPGQTVNVYVQVTVPAGAYASIEDDDSTKEFTSLSYQAMQCTGTPPAGEPPPGYTSLSGTSDAAVTRVEPYRNFIIAPDNFGAALPGQTVTYTHVITNIGNLTDTYNIIPFSGFYALAEIAEPGSGQITLSPLQSATVIISVTINPEAAGGLIDVSSAIAQSQGDTDLEKAAANNTTISYTTGTRYVSLTGQDSLVDETEIAGTDYKDNNCTQPDVAACRTIQQAIDQAASSDLIKIDQGIYTDILAVTHKGQTITQTAFVNESVMLQGGYDRNNWSESPPNHTAHTTTLDLQGQGRAFYVVDGTTVTVDRLVIRNGDATGLGGGPDGEDAGGNLYNEGADLTLNANRIYDGYADLGGGLYHSGSDLLLQNNLLHGNTVISDGGAVYVYSGTVVLENNTFHDNQAGGDGGAVYVDADNLVVTNTIFANNVSSGGAVHGDPATTSLDYNLYDNNSASDTGGTIPAPPAPHDVMADPLFVAPGDTPPDLHLQNTSPARETGDPATNTSLIPLDYENNPRILGYRVDIGAYEYIIEPGVELEPDHETYTSQDVTIIYIHTLTNTGDLTDTFDLAYASSQGWATLLTSSPITVGPQVTATVEVSVTVPPEGVGGLVDVTVIIATSRLTTTVFDTAVNTTTVEMLPGVELAPDHADSADPGTLVTYTHTLTNAGDGPDVFDLTHHSSQGWQVVYDTPITVGYNQTATVIVSVTVPSGAISSTVDTTTITATSQYSTAVSASVVDTTTINQVLGVGLAPNHSQTTSPNAAVVYSHTLTNEGNYTGTFTIVWSSSQGWPVSLLQPTTPVTLSPWQTATVVISLTVPPGSGGLVDVTTITATLQGYPAVYAVVTDTTTVTQTVGVELEPDHADTTDSGTTITYTHTLTNTGDGPDVFDLTLSSSQGWPVSLLAPVTPVALTAGQTETVVISLTVPPGSFGLVDVTTITATSQTDTNIFATATDTTTVSMTPDVELEPDRSSNADPGTLVTYTHTLTNAGNGPDTFNLQAISSQGWTVVVSPTSVLLDPHQTHAVVVTVTVPSGAISSTVDTTTITATSQYSTAVSASVADTTTVNRILGVQLAPNRSQSTDPDTTVVYTHTLTNAGNYTDTFNLAWSSSHGWPVSLLQPTTPVTLSPWQTATVVISLTVPPGTGGLVDVTTITATLQDVPAVQAVVTDTTTVSQVVSVTLQPDQIGSTDPDTTITYTHTLTNTGNGPDVFDLTLSSSQGWPVSLLTPTTPVALTAGQTETVVISLTVPVGTGGLMDVAVITATSRADTGIFATATDTTTVPLTPGVDLSPDHAGTAYSDTVAVYTHVLTNTGNGTDTFDIEAASDQGWTVAWSPNSVALAAGQTHPVVVSITVPLDAISGTVDSTIVTATSQADGNIFAFVVNTTTVVERPGGPVYLPLVMANYEPTPIPDGPDLVVTDISVDPASPGAGESATVCVTVRNQGNRAMQSGNNFWVDFYVNTEPIPGTAGDLSWGAQGSDFGIGATRDFCDSYSFTAGAHQLYAQADTDNTVTERFEDNNVFGPVPLNVVGVGSDEAPVAPAGSPTPGERRPRPTPTPIPQ
jgi:uncharacterized membrane protein